MLGVQSISLAVATLVLDVVYVIAVVTGLFRDFVIIVLVHVELGVRPCNILATLCPRTASIVLRVARATTTMI